MDIPWWEKLLPVPVILAIIALLEKVGRFIVAARAEHNLKRVTEVYKILNEYSSKLECDRMLILSAHNCGGPLKNNVPLRASILYEISHLEPRFDKFQDYPLDQHYVSMLVDLIQGGSVTLETEHLPKKSFLKTVYETDEINHSLIYLITATDKEVLYLAACFKRPLDPSFELKDQMNSLQNKLSPLLTKKSKWALLTSQAAVAIIGGMVYFNIF